MNRALVIFSVLLLAGVVSTGLVLATDTVKTSREDTVKTSRGDTVKTSRGDLEIHPLNHATFAMKWNGKSIYVDPVGSKERFRGLPAPDLILITDVHGDHLNPAVVRSVRKDSTVIVAPAAVAQQLEKAGVDAKSIQRLANGEKREVLGVKVKAIPMYNLTAERKRFHTKGRGNGYVLDFGGTRVYISGDTEDVPEMRALEKIDVAFICMNLPFTMTAERAASAVLEFRPRVVYPYHYRGRGEGGTQDPKKFESLVGAKSKKIDVRLRDWYSKK
ncbi:MAG: MBL fold metallo-hydrolase [Planctomycetota bacterium]|nr:MBL fold metallo-hydrolase [Planctomycetota bacterium]